MNEGNGVWLIESPITMVEGEQIAFSVDWLGASKVTDPAVDVYKNGTDITQEVMNADDEHVISGNVLTLKKLRARETDGGARYVMVIEANVNSNTERRKLLIHIIRAESEA